MNRKIIGTTEARHDTGPEARHLNLRAAVAQLEGVSLEEAQARLNPDGDPEVGELLRCLLTPGLSLAGRH